MESYMHGDLELHVLRVTCTDTVFTCTRLVSQHRIALQIEMLSGQCETIGKHTRAIDSTALYILRHTEKNGGCDILYSKIYFYEYFHLFGC